MKILFAILLFCFLVKHFLGDFLLQTAEISLAKREGYKGLAIHSLSHAGLTFMVILAPVLALTFPWWLLLVVPAMDFVLHFGIDKFKIFLEQRNQVTYKDKGWLPLQFLDQSLHLLCYIGYIVLILSV